MERKYNQGVADSNKRRAVHGATSRKKGTRVTSKTYNLWIGIKQRCTNPKHSAYHRYGGRGVTLHPEWAADFSVFLSAVGEPPDPLATLDRIDNDRGYEPGNVRWASRKEQANNRSTNVVITRESKTMTLKQWAEHLGWKYGLIAGRWKAGLRGDDLFAAPKHERNKSITFNGETRTLPEWAKLTGVPYVTLHWRLKNNKPLF